MSTMYVLVILVMVSEVYGFFRPICNGTMYNEEYYDTLTLFKKFGRSYDLVIHESSGNVFFSHGNEYLKRQIVGCNLETHKCWNVTEAGRGFTLFYNRLKDYLYFGGPDGIYEYNVTANTSKFVGAKKTKVWRIFVMKNKLFYIEYPSHHLYMIENKTTIVQIGNKQYDYYYVSKHFVHYYTNKIGELYKIEKPATFSKEGVLLNHKLTVRQITEDIYGVIYICAKTGIYIDDGPFRRVNRIIEFEDLYSIAIIKKLIHDNKIVKDEFIVIYSNQNGIYKFYPSPYAKYCVNKTNLGAVRMATTALYDWVSFSVKADFM